MRYLTWFERLVVVILALSQFAPSYAYAERSFFPEEVFSNHATIMLVVDVNSGAIERANRAATRFYGYTESELQSMHIQDINALSESQIADERAAAAKEDRNYFIFPHQLKSGEVRTVEVYSYPNDASHTTLLSMIYDITDRVFAEKTIQEYISRFQRTEAIVGVGHWQFHLSDGTIVASDGAKRVYGLDDREWTMDLVQQIPLPEYRSMLDKALKALVTDGVPYDVEFQIRRESDGQVADVRSIAEYDPDRNIVFGSLLDITDYNYALAALRTGHNQVIVLTAIIIVAGAITILTLLFLLRQRKRLISGLTRNEDLLRTAQEIGQLGSWELDVATNQLAWSEEVYRIFGLQPQQIPATYEAFLEAVHPDDRENVDRAYVNSANSDSDGYEIEHRIVKANTEEVRYVREKCVHVRNSLGVVIRSIGMVQDVTDQKHAIQQVEHLSFHDALTGLYNRRFYEEELRRLDVPRNLPLAILMIDVNGLKLTNDAFGHDVGDALLRTVAEVLRKNCRADEIVARIGGDEFAILMPKTEGIQPERLTERVRQAMSQETIAGLPLSIAGGWAVKTLTTTPIGEVFKEAEDNMYRNKVSEQSSHRYQAIQLIVQTIYAKSPRERQHAERVSQLCSDIGNAMGLHQSEIDQLVTAGELHDIGKISVSNEILDKDGPLDDSEWEQIKRHPQAGHSILSAVNDYGPLAESVLAHHERWDGSGYPNGWKKGEIPKAARIIALADAYDAMTSDRPYRSGMSHAEAMAEIRRCSENQFDPAIAEVFTAMIAEKRMGLSEDVESPTISHRKYRNQTVCPEESL